MTEKIAVLCGGMSCEREVSLVSGKAVSDALYASGYDVLVLDPIDERYLEILKQHQIKKVFLALHGTFGEDGTIQDILEKEEFFYTGSSAQPSRKAFDKSVTQEILKRVGVLVPDFKVYAAASELGSGSPVGYPCVVKPCSAGSSVGVSIVREEGAFGRACMEAWKYSDKIMVEAYIQGRELTVGLLGDRALPVVEVIANNVFYDYQAKYKDNQTRYECPANVSESISQQAQNAAMEVCRALGCQVMARVDMILAEDNRLYVLEINTLPGMTNKSLLPKAAKAAGMEFGELCVKILELSCMVRFEQYEALKK